MKQKSYTVILLASVFVGSFLITLITDPETTVGKIAQYPGLLALFGALWKILQDEIRDQRNIKIADSQALNSLFAGSHYASRVYDKQLEFCEGYWRHVLDIIKEMGKEAESPVLVQKANDLYTYRMERAIWLPENLTLDLEGFEKALRSLGAESSRIDKLPVGTERSKRVDNMMRMFEEIMHISSTKNDENKTLSYVAVLSKLQEVLGVSIGYQWRQGFLERAANR